MELSRATEIINSLADGLDPATGKAFGQESPYQNPEIIRALHVVIDALPRRLRRTDGPKNTGKAWTPEDEAELTNQFESGISLEDLAAKYERTKAGIITRLVKLGKADPGQFPDYDKYLHKKTS